MRGLIRRPTTNLTDRVGVGKKCLGFPAISQTNHCIYACLQTFVHSRGNRIEAQKETRTLDKQTYNTVSGVQRFIEDYGEVCYCTHTKTLGNREICWAWEVFQGSVYTTEPLRWQECIIIRKGLNIYCP